jgi:hypothetical protein
MTFIQSLYHRHTTTNGRLEGQVHRTDALGLLERWDLVLTAFCGRGLPRDAMSSRRCLELTARCSSAGKAAVGKQPASVARSDRYTKKERNSRAGRVIKERNWAGKDEERKERNLEAEKIAESPNPCGWRVGVQVFDGVQVYAKESTAMSESVMRSCEQTVFQTTGDHLAPQGVLVLNFCLPFYSLEEQLRLMKVYREVFRHLHVLEATPTSKIVVAYNWEPRREHADVAAQLDAATAECGWPAARRDFNYHTYLPRDESWSAEWGRALHQEASEYFCASGQLPRAYCSWFTPRHELAKAVPVTYFGSMEQEMALRKAKNDWRRAVPIAHGRLNWRKSQWIAAFTCAFYLPKCSQ